jgi:hypothetical protein
VVMRHLLKCVTLSKLLKNLDCGTAGSQEGYSGEGRTEN